MRGARKYGTQASRLRNIWEPPRSVMTFSPSTSQHCILSRAYNIIIYMYPSPSPAAPAPPQNSFASLFCEIPVF